MKPADNPICPTCGHALSYRPRSKRLIAAVQRALTGTETVYAIAKDLGIDSAHIYRARNAILRRRSQESACAVVPPDA